jgi:disulfide bond formation protein DsbB
MRFMIVSFPRWRRREVIVTDTERQLATIAQPGHTQAMKHRSPRSLAVLVAIAAAAALGVAYGSERWGGLVPCALCLLERWPYRIVIVLGLLAALLPRGLARGLLGLAVLAMLGGAVLGAVHVGVEFQWWPSPLPECAAPHISGASIAERLASMPARPSKPCDDPTYLIPGVPLSMAAMNLLFSLVFAATLATSLSMNRSRR